jgi:hypothetical protein
MLIWFCTMRNCHSDIYSIFFVFLAPIEGILENEKVGLFFNDHVGLCFL